MRIFIEAVGSLTSGAFISNIKESGNYCIASDADACAVGRFLADDFCQVPFANNEKYIETVKVLLEEKKVDLVIPTLDDGLLKWDSMRDSLRKGNIAIALSSHDALITCLDKWNTYNCFIEHGIPTPKTSLKQEYDLVKPRKGRGGSGVQITDKPVDMAGMISQEVLLGTEYTVDVFCNIEHKPVYIVPRKRQGVKEGKSTGGEVVYKPDIAEIVSDICKVIAFTGAINIQCFDTKEGIKITEINPRFGGGTVLGMKATENWIPLTVDSFCNQKTVQASKCIQYGLKMGRYYAEVFYK